MVGGSRYILQRTRKTEKREKENIYFCKGKEKRRRKRREIFGGGKYLFFAEEKKTENEKEENI